MDEAHLANESFYAFCAYAESCVAYSIQMGADNTSQLREPKGSTQDPGATQHRLPSREQTLETENEQRSWLLGGLLNLLHGET